MRRKNLYVVDVNSEFQVLIFKSYHDECEEDFWEFYLSDGFCLVYQFGLSCECMPFSELEGFARYNFNNGYMTMKYDIFGSS